MDNYDNDLIKLDYRKRPKKSADNMTPYDKACLLYTSPSPRD